MTNEELIKQWPEYPLFSDAYSEQEKNEMRAALQEIAARLRAMSWRTDMENAPKSKRVLITLKNGKKVVTAIWDDAVGQEASAWMPLPNPPGE